MIKQGPDHGADARRIAIWRAKAERSAASRNELEQRGIGAGAGSAVGIATTLLTRGKEVELRQGSTLDVVFDRAIAIE